MGRDPKGSGSRESGVSRQGGRVAGETLQTRFLRPDGEKALLVRIRLYSSRGSPSLFVSPSDKFQDCSDNS